MPFFGSHSSAVTPPKSRLISGPMHARHVGGVSITGGTGGNTSLDTYFVPTSLEPDVLPSHTYAASGTTEVPRRSKTFTDAVRRPSLSMKRSISRLRSGSRSRSSEGHRRNSGDNRPGMMDTISDSTVPSVQHTIQRKPTPVYADSGACLDQDILAPSIHPGWHKEDAVPALPPKDDYRIISTYVTSVYPQIQNHNVPPRTQRKDTLPPLPPRPRRADSGTAVDFDHLPVRECPKGFKEILAVKHYKDRMALYESTRDYWANAEHGLAEWTGRSGGPRMVQSKNAARWL